MEYWLEFELLKHARGKEYAMQRNRILQSRSGLEDRLAPYLANQDWLTAATGNILSGWIRNQDIFGTVQKNLNDEDLSKAKASAMGMDVIYKKYRHFAKQYGAALLPFAWEMLLKQEGDVEDWKSIAMTHVIAELPHPLSTDILIHFIETTSSENLRDAAVSTLAQIVNEQEIEKVKKAKARHEIISDELDQIVEESAAMEAEAEAEKMDEDDEGEDLGDDE